MTGSREIGETIGYQLRRLRRLRGLTQEELADRANVSRDLVAKLEQGQRQTARITSLVSLACALDVELSALVVAGNAKVVTELAASVAGNDPGPLATVQTTHHVDMAIAALADQTAISYLRRWLDDGHDSVLRVNAAGILAKLPGQGEASRVADALSRDGEVRDRYMTAVVARVCGVDWSTASGLIREPSMFRQPALVAGRFAYEAVCSRDAGARWCSAAMLQALSPMIGRSSSWS